MPAEIQQQEAREARAEFVRAALVVLDTFRQIKGSAFQSLETNLPDLVLELEQLESAKLHWRMFALPDEMVRP